MIMKAKNSSNKYRLCKTHMMRWWKILEDKSMSTGLKMVLKLSENLSMTVNFKKACSIAVSFITVSSRRDRTIFMTESRKIQTLILPKTTWKKRKLRKRPLQIHMTQSWIWQLGEIKPIESKLIHQIFVCRIKIIVRTPRKQVRLRRPA